MRERMKTVSVALVICLNVGVDPPDVTKTQPCARQVILASDWLTVIILASDWLTVIITLASYWPGVLGGPQCAQCTESARDNRRQPPEAVREVHLLFTY